MTPKEAAFEVWCWQYSNTDCFNQRLIDLYRKGDGGNKYKLKSAYPELLSAVDLWERAETQEAFFKEYGLTV